MAVNVLAFDFSLPLPSLQKPVLCQKVQYTPDIVSESVLLAPYSVVYTRSVLLKVEPLVAGFLDSVDGARTVVLEPESMGHGERSRS